MFLKAADVAVCGAAAAVAGGGTLFACLLLDTDPMVTAIASVASGVAVQRIALGFMKRRAWHRENARRS